ncbi:MAG: 4Fe-4S binding protein [Anaerolineae bacterium]|jgi:Pyruvate/2-oxoacid:ferredoxin oxidoreductase delta subunit
MTTLTVWIDAARCTRCGHCLDACPREAIALVNGKARVDETTCSGCEQCVVVCPEDAIQPVLQGELVPAAEQPAPSVRQTSPLAETAGAAIVLAGTSLLMRAARGAVQALGRWLLNRPLAVSSTGNGVGRRSGSDGRPDTRGYRGRRRHRGG